MYLVVFYVGEYVWVCGCMGVYTKSKTSELSPLRRKLLRFAKQFPPPLRSKKWMRKGLSENARRGKYLRAYTKEGVFLKRKKELFIHSDALFCA
jgi:hypothetical protein